VARGPLAAGLIVALATARGASFAAAPPPAPAGSIAVPGSPTGIALGAGGALLAVSFDGRFGVGGGVAVYRKHGTTYARTFVARFPQAAEAVALGPNSRTLVLTTRIGLAALEIPAQPGASARVSYVRDGDAPDGNQLALSHDGHYAYFTNERYATLGVARVTPGVGGNPPQLAVLAHVPLDRSPGGVVLSPDGTRLFVTSEVASPAFPAPPGASDPRVGRARCAFNLGPSGVLSVVDAGKALSDPAHAVVARVAAGCATTRVVLAPDGATAWVTARGENRVLAFDVAKLSADPEHAFAAEVAVGDVPVGLALSGDGKRLLVANSHRSRDADLAQDANLSLIDPAAALAGAPALLGTLPTGSLAREVSAAPDGSFLVTDYLSRALDVVGAARLAAARPAPGSSPAAR
jgi:DNA-binding beta-propeller fold protein YncE